MSDIERDQLVRFLHSNGDGGIWEAFDRDAAETVADAILAAGVLSCPDCRNTEETP